MSHTTVTKFGRAALRVCDFASKGTASAALERRTKENVLDIATKT